MHDQFLIFLHDHSQALKRRTLVILLLLFFVAPAVTTLGVFRYQKMIIRKEAKQKIFAGIDKSELELFVFHSSDPFLNKLEPLGEFRLKGDMYDIVSMERQDDSVYLYCWHDHEETGLDEKLDDLVSLGMANNTTNRENQQRLDHFHQTLFSPQHTRLSFLIPTFQSAIRYLFLITYRSQSILPPVPPP
jgi:hypothetical protein